MFNHIQGKQYSQEEKLKKAFAGIKEEFEEHLQSINDNTAEIQANQEYLNRLDAKINKVQETLEQVELFLGKVAGLNFTHRGYEDIKPLTHKEKEIFLILYTEPNGTLTFNDIAKRMNAPETVVKDYVSCIIAKGVPLNQRYFNSKAYLSLDEDFKTAQAKQNILEIQQKLAF
jgi:hypothetical protein